MQFIILADSSFFESCSGGYNCVKSEALLFQSLGFVSALQNWKYSPCQCQNSSVSWEIAEKYLVLQSGTNYNQKLKETSLLLPNILTKFTCPTTYFNFSFIVQFTCSYFILGNAFYKEKRFKATVPSFIY